MWSEQEILVTVSKHKLFISYSHKDARWLVPIREQLAVLETEGIIDVFVDSMIEAGDEWYAKIEEEILDSDVALLVISASFLNSPFVRREEIPRLLNQVRERDTFLYPLLLRDCPWQERC